MFPRLLIPSSRGFPPVVAWRGTSPSQAARSLPRANVSALPIAATRAVAFITPTPGMLARRRVLPGVACELVVEHCNAAVELAPLRLHILNQDPHARADTKHFAIGQHLGQTLLQLAAALRNNDSALEQNGAKLIDQRRAFTDQT